MGWICAYDTYIFDFVRDPWCVPVDRRQFPVEDGLLHGGGIWVDRLKSAAETVYAVLSYFMITMQATLRTL